MTVRASQPRGTCRVCRLNYAVRKDGRIGRHNGMNRAGFSTGRPCPGVGLPPVKAGP